LVIARVLPATRTLVLVRDDEPYNVLGDGAGRFVDVHTFDDTTTELGPDGNERYGPDGLPYEVGEFTRRGTNRMPDCHGMSTAFQMRSHTGYGLDDGDWHDVLDRPENGH
jgi:hypothetical protein